MGIYISLLKVPADYTGHGHPNEKAFFMKKVVIKDDMGKNLMVDLEKFIDHINHFHNNGVSIHEEGGHFFTVDNNFRKKLKRHLKAIDNRFEQED